MDPIAFQIGSLEIRWYGIAMALSMLVGAWIAARLLDKNGRDGNVMWDALFWIIAWSIVGARLIYVLTNLGDYADEPWKVFAVWEGGLAFHGGIIAGGIVAWNIFQSRGIPPLEAFDAMVPGVSIGIILVRLGNFMNGDILGYKWNGPGAMNFPYDEYHNYGATKDEIILRHPTELYGLFVGLICLVVSVALWHYTYRNKKLHMGAPFLGCFITYSLARGVLEDPFRAVPLVYQVTPDPQAVGYGLFTTSQIVSAFLIIILLLCITQLPKWERLQLAHSASLKKHGVGSESRQVKRAKERGEKKTKGDDKPGPG